MPIAYDIDPKAGLLTVFFEGNVTVAELDDYFERSRQDPRFTTTLLRLIVASDLTSFPRADDLWPRSEVVRDRVETRPRFAVVATTPLAIGLASMFSGLVGLTEYVELFADRESAVRWLLSGEPGSKENPR
jgi:hypothetical protein